MRAVFPQGAHLRGRRDLDMNPDGQDDEPPDDPPGGGGGSRGGYGKVTT